MIKLQSTPTSAYECQMIERIFQRGQLRFSQQTTIFLSDVITPRFIDPYISPSNPFILYIFICFDLSN